MKTGVKSTYYLMRRPRVRGNPESQIVIVYSDGPYKQLEARVSKIYCSNHSSVRTKAVSVRACEMGITATGNVKVGSAPVC